MRKKVRESNAGVGTGSVLQIVFIVLKLCGLIDWSWWWVMSPTWISAGIVALLLLVVALIRRIGGNK